MKTLISLCLVLFLATGALCQNLTQTVRGTVKDIDTKSVLIGATVFIVDSNPVIGGITNVDGQFRLENVPIGRVTLSISYIGYEPALIPNVVVNTGKEVILNLELLESATRMNEVIITAQQTKGEPLNDMAMISARSISPEETSRYAGGFNDPAKITANFAGVTATQDGSNDIIVRGNSPKYVQWRLEGVPITNPNHFADQSAAGGAVSTLNNNMLAASDFYTGAFSPEYGNALSGVYDVRLRTGNSEQHERVFGFGLLGTDLNMEGPFKKGYSGSFNVNYRYSTASVLARLGLLPDEVQGIPNFQDASFKVVLPTKTLGTFSAFGIGGMSDIYFEDIKPNVWNVPGDRGMKEEILEDFDKKSYLINTGINHSVNFNRNSYLNTTLAFSAEGIKDRTIEKSFVKEYDDNELYVRDILKNVNVNFRGEVSRNTYQAATTYHHKLNAKNKIQIGTRLAFHDYSILQSQYDSLPSGRYTLADHEGMLPVLNNHVSWKHRVNENVTIVSGLHNMNVLYNNKSTLEPRAALSWKYNAKSTLSFGYGLHSSMESVHNYFAQVKQENGVFTQPNKDLDLLKAHHYVLGIENRLTPNIKVKLELYYQDLYNLPVENDPGSMYATVNEGLEFQYVDLVNEGSGENYGVELTLERFFKDNYYFLLNGSIYESKYIARDGIKRDTQYAGDYLVNLLGGKEFPGLGKKKNQTLGLNVKAYFGGGRKIIPLLRDEEGNLAVDPDNNQFWDYSQAYQRSLDDLYMITLATSYKWNKPKATHELFIQLENITNTKGKMTEYYDPDEPDKVGNMAQFGLFPNLMYRIYF